MLPVGDNALCHHPHLAARDWKHSPNTSSSPEASAPPVTSVSLWIYSTRHILLERQGRGATCMEVSLTCTPQPWSRVGKYYCILKGRDESTPPNAISVTSPLESVTVRRAQRHPSCGAAPSGALAMPKTKALQKPGWGSPRRRRGPSRGHSLPGRRRRLSRCRSLPLSLPRSPSTLAGAFGERGNPDSKWAFWDKRQRRSSARHCPDTCLVCQGKSDPSPSPPGHGCGSSCCISTRIAGSAQELGIVFQYLLKRKNIGKG